MELILWVCLVAAPQTCKEEHLSFSIEPVAEMRCLAGAMPIIAEWSGTHPKWRVARWRCGNPRLQGRSA